MAIYSKITGTGSFLPETVITNHDLAKRIDTSHDWIVERTGIHRRHVVSEKEDNATMAIEASRHAIESAGISADAIDLIIVATCTPNKILPSTACQVQNALAIGPCFALDVNAACTGFVYALSIADKYIRDGSAKHALVVGTEAMSRIIDWEDRRTCIIFGDGAGAVVLSPDSNPGVLSTHLYADGSYGDLLEAKYPQNAGDKTIKPSYVYMEGNRVFKLAVKALGDLVQLTLEQHSYSQDDINWLVPHQANIRIIESTANKLKMPMDRVILTVADHANTSAASIPLALDTGVRDGRIKRGELLLFESFGGGITWGSALVKF